MDLALRIAWSRARAADALLGNARLYGLVYLNETALGTLTIYYDKAVKEYVLSRAYSMDVAPLFQGAHGMAVAILVQFWTASTVWSREPLVQPATYEGKG